LRVALLEFAAKGLSGARVDRIAALAKTSKRMIYYHFKNKEQLYSAALDHSYAEIRAKEAALDTEHMSPPDALRAIVTSSFDHHCQNALFVRLVMSENIHHARHISPSTVANSKQIIKTLTRILARGTEDGSFRPGIDPTHLHLTISGLGFHYVSNRPTFSHIFDMDMESSAAQDARRKIAADIVLRWCLKSP
jgi:AcrR family transcriptional regulator